MRPTDRQAHQVARGAPVACCQQKENMDAKDEGQGCTTITCRRCGRKHRIMKADPIRFGVSPGGASPLSIGVSRR